VRTCDVDGCDKPVERENHDYYDDEDASCDICGYKREIKKPDPPVIVNKELEGAVKIIKSSQSELEEAYVTWEIDENAKWYNVYVKATGTNNYTKLDAPLVRKYSTYFRADAVGLAKGTYDLKVVPVLTDGTEAEDKYSGEVTGINVKAHQRFGFGFLGGSASGAYNDDGTLRSGAQVFYITAETAKTVKATVTKKGKPVDATGFQSILDARESSQDSTPLCFRIVGTVTKSDLDHVSSSEEGLQIKSTGNITIEGIGSDGTIKDFGMLLRNDNNVEVRNLGILNCMDDGISIDTDNQHLWMHNNDIFYGAGGSGDKAKGDGALDTKGSTLITHSYNHFWDCGKCNLQGMKSEKEDYRITYHHNWYDHSDSRHPRIRTATVHIFNNYFDGNAKYGVGVTMGASAFVENNYFRSTTMMRPMMSSKQGTDILDDPEHKGTFSGEDGGIIKSFGNTYDSPNLKLRPYSADNTVEFDCYEASSRNEQVPASVKTKFGSTSYNNFDTASDFYKYEVESPEDAKENVQRYAGRVDGGDLQWTFNNEVDDKDYAVNSALKAAVTGYKTTVVAIGEGSAGSAGTGPVVKPDPIDPNPIDPNPVTPNPSSYKQTATFLTENEKYAKNGKIADGTSFTATVNKDVVVTKDISTAKADDATGMTFNYGLLPGGKDLAVTVKANEAITLTIYYTVSDSKFSTGDQAKEGNLSWKINGGATVDSTKTGKKDNKVAYSETITLEAGQEVVFTISKNRLVIFGIFAS
nr:hypothetical protein [Clostridia bacterium]